MTPREVKRAKTKLKAELKGEINLHNNELIEILSVSENEPELAFWALKCLLRRPNADQLLSRLLKKRVRIIKSIFFNFPVIDRRGSGGKITEAVAAVINNENVVKVIGSNAILPIPVLKDIKKGLLIAFRDKFSGKSFHAPLVYSILFSPPLGPFVLSGEIARDSTGDFRNYSVKEPDKVKEKLQLCKEKNLFLIYSSPSLNLLRKSLNSEFFHFPLFLGRDKTSAMANYENFLKATALSRAIGTKNFADYGMLLTPEKLSEKEAIKVLKLVGARLKTLEKIFSRPGGKFKKLHFHIGLDIPSSLAFGVGVIFSMSQFRRLTVYHYDMKTFEYSPIFFSSSRETIEDFKIVKENWVEAKRKNGTSGIVNVAISIARRISLAQDSESTVELYTDKTGNFPLDKLGSALCLELFSKIENLYRELNPKKIRLFLSTPVAVGFTLGYLLGYYKNIDVYQYNAKEGNYYRLFSVGEDINYDFYSSTSPEN